MPEEIAEYDVAFTCAFCGNKFTEKYHADVGLVHKTVSGCRRCVVSVSAKKGTKIRYDAAERRPRAATYADFHLKRGETYTVRKTKQWQHGCWVYLEGFDHKEFDIMIFVPDKFRHEKDGQ